MTPILGVIDSAKTGNLSTTAFESITTVTVGATAVASIDFTSIPQNYKHLQIRGILRSDRAGAADDLLMQINSDTGNNYAWQGLIGDGTSVAYNSSTSQPNIKIMRNSLPSSTTASGFFAAIIIDILDYTNTNKNKVTRTSQGGEFNGTITGYLGPMVGLWQNTNAITSLTIREETTANLVQYSQLALYGIKG